LRLFFLAAPTSPDLRLEEIATHSKGFVYAISRVGITGTQQNMTSDAESLVARIRRWTKLPVAVGFGISNSEHVARWGGLRMPRWSQRDCGVDRTVNPRRSARRSGSIYQGPALASCGAGPVRGTSP